MVDLIIVLYFSSILWCFYQMVASKIVVKAIKVLFVDDESGDFDVVPEGFLKAWTTFCFCLISFIPILNICSIFSVDGMYKEALGDGKINDGEEG